MRSDRCPLRVLVYENNIVFVHRKMGLKTYGQRRRRSKLQIITLSVKLM